MERARNEVRCDRSLHVEDGRNNMVCQKVLSPILTVLKMKMKTHNCLQLFQKILSFRFSSRIETENIAQNLSFSRLRKRKLEIVTL